MKVLLLGILLSTQAFASQAPSNFQLTFWNKTKYDVSITEAYINLKNNGWQVLDAGKNKVIDAGKKTCYSDKKNPIGYPGSSDSLCSASTRPFSFVAPPFSTSKDRRKWKFKYKCNGKNYDYNFQSTHDLWNTVNTVDYLIINDCGDIERGN